MYNNVVSTILMLGLTGLIFFWIWLLSRRPENKGVPWGVALIRNLVKQHVSYLMGFVIVTNLASAGIAATISGPDSNPASRIMTHFAIFAVSVFGAFSLLPSWRLMVTKEKITPGRRFARGLAFIIMFVFAIIAPIVNMFLIAHALDQVPHLNLFFMSIAPQFMVSDDAYITALINSGVELPDNIRAYSPFQNMRTILAAEFWVMVFGMLVLFVEVLTAPDNHVKTLHQMEEEAEADNKKEEEKKKEDKKEDKPIENALASNFTKILAFCNIPYTELIIKNAVNTVEEFSTEDQFTFSNELDDLYANVVKHTSLKTQPEKDKNLADTEKGIREIFARSKKNLGIGQQLKARKK